MREKVKHNGETMMKIHLDFHGFNFTRHPLDRRESDCRPIRNEPGCVPAGKTSPARHCGPFSPKVKLLLSHPESTNRPHPHGPAKPSLPDGFAGI
jgi:hypothetical protein